jgi:N-glycosylase/DNA lyase
VDDVWNIEFSITSRETCGPFNLHHTMQSGQTSEPYWPQINGGYWDADIIDGKPVRYEVHPNPDAEKPILDIRITGAGVNEDTAQSIRTYLIELFRLQDDLPSFYQKFQTDKISPAFKEFSGLRLMKASNPYESLICSICSQHSSVEQWNRTIRCIRTSLGEKYILPNGATFHSFPSPDTLAITPVARLENCQAGYRAEYMMLVSKMIVDGDLDLDRLKQTSYEDAKNELMELPGIGPKVADCFLLYGLGQTRAAPVDIWIHRIVPKVYFGGAKMTKDEVGKFLRKKFGEWAGLAQLYLYHYGRMRSNTLFPASRRL